MDYSDTSDQECDEREDQEDENEEEEDGHLEDMLDQDLNWELEVQNVTVQVRFDRIDSLGLQAEEEVEAEGGRIEDREGREGGQQQWVTVPRAGHREIWAAKADLLI